MLVGRGSELACVLQLLDDVRTGRPQALVIAGEAGIGKTTLVETLVQHADQMTVLRARGIDSEAQVAYGGLFELLRPVLELLDRLPERWRKALRGALALEPGPASDQLAVWAATLEVFAEAGQRRPTLVIVDDAQWLDSASRGAILFAARRLVAERVGVVICFEGDRAFGDAEYPLDLPQLHLERLTAEATHALVDHLAGAGLRAPARDVIERASMGNPLAIIELTRGAENSGDQPPGAPVPPVAHVAQVFGARLASLSAGARRLLLLIAASDRAETALITRAARRAGLETSAAEEAELAGLLVVGPQTLELVHPLARGVVYHSAPPPERRAAHRLLGDAMDGETDLERRAWHLAAATVGVDERAGAALEEAGRFALTRTGHAWAARCFERAADLREQTEPRARRLQAAGEAYWYAGSPERGLRLLGAARDMTSEVELSARASRILGAAIMRAGHLRQAGCVLARAATRLAPAQPQDASLMFSEAAMSCSMAGDAQGMLDMANKAAALAADGPVAVRLPATLALGWALTWTNEPNSGRRHLATALELATASSPADADPTLLAGLGLLQLGGEAQVGRPAVKTAIESARQQGAFGALPLALGLLAAHDRECGAWEEAQAEAAEALELAAGAAQAGVIRAANWILGSIAAARGEGVEAERHASDALRLAEEHELPLWQSRSLRILGLLHLGQGSLGGAVDALERAVELTPDAQRAFTTSPPGATSEDPLADLVEAHIRAGRLDAAAAAARHVQAGLPSWLPGVRAVHLRIRALLAGDGEYERLFREALASHDQATNRFERARTDLCFGERLRRAGRRRDAREPLGRALAEFEVLDARPWATRARDELLASGARARRRSPDARDQLTPQERRIARLAVGGSTNREVAERLFLSPKTIEYHLHNVFIKLNVRSRKELRDHALHDPSRADLADRARL